MGNQMDLKFGGMKMDRKNEKELGRMGKKMD